MMGFEVECWSSAPLENLLTHVIGGDWGNDENYQEDGFVAVSCIRGSEFKNWNTDFGSTSVTRRIKSSSLDTRKLEAGDLLIEISGGGPEQPVGRTVLITERVLNQLSYPPVCTNFLRLVRPSKFVDSNFLNYYLMKFYLSGEVVNYQGGSNNLRNLKFKDYSKIEIPLPPEAEQKIIADKLDTLLEQAKATKTRLERIPNILKRFRQSVLAAAMSGKLTEDWRERHDLTNLTFELIKKKKQKLVDSKSIKNDLEAEEAEPIFELPDSWLNLKLKSIASKVTDGEHKTPKRENSGRYLLSARNVQDGYISVANVDYVGEEEFEKLRKRCDPNKGDILISCSGSVGRVCMVDEDDKYVMVRSAALVRILDEFIQSKFLMYLLQSPASQKNIEESSRSTAQSNLFLGPIKELGIVVPPLEEQTEIVSRVEEFFTLASTIEKKANTALERVNKLTQSILDKAFRGELTVDWRANNAEFISGENSSEVLLAKLKAERAGMKPTKQTPARNNT